MVFTGNSHFACIHLDLIKPIMKISVFICCSHNQDLRASVQVSRFSSVSKKHEMAFHWFNSVNRLLFMNIGS